MIRIVRQKSTEIRCTLIQIVLLIAMMLSLAFPQSEGIVRKTAGLGLESDNHRDIFTGYTYSEAQLL